MSKRVGVLGVEEWTIGVGVRKVNKIGSVGKNWGEEGKCHKSEST